CAGNPIRPGRGKRAGFSSQGMSRANMKTATLATERTDLVRAVRRQRTNFGDEEFDLLAVQAFKHCVPVVHLDAKVRLRMAAAQLSKDARHQRGRRKRTDTEGKVAESTITVERDITLQRSRIEQQTTRTLDQECARGRRPHLARFAVEQAMTDGLFKRLDAATESRLAQMNAFRGASEMALIRKRDKVT
ncbi:MAG: hypothetical protein ABIR27_05455, partial [Dokdonella sp.]